MSVQFSITVPDDLNEIIEMLVTKKSRTKSAICIYLMEKGLSPATRELNDIEVAKIFMKDEDNS